MSRRAVFLDRDGTLIEDCGYLSDPAKVRILPGVAEGVARLQAAGFALVVVTNQSGIGRGMFPEADYHRVTAEIIRQLAPITLDGIYFCPSFDDRDPDRKPAPGMLLRAAADLDLDLGHSWMIGDAPRDTEAGRRAGCQGAILLRSTNLPPPLEAIIVANDFPHAVAHILSATES